MSKTETIETIQQNSDDQERKKTCKEALERTKLALMQRGRWAAFIREVIMRQNLIPVMDDRCPTACADGDSIFVNANFFLGLDTEEREFVLAHEVWHTCLMHFSRQENRDQQLFNIAADLEIHFVLLDDEMKEPFVLPHDPSWRGKSAEEIYEILLQQQQQGCSSGDGGSNNGNQEENGGISKYRNGISNEKFGNNYSSFDKQDWTNGWDIPPEDVAKKSGSNQVKFDPDYTPERCTQNRIEHVRGTITGVAQETELRHGAIPGAMKNILDKPRNPEIKWQELLRRFMTSCDGGRTMSWIPPSRRYTWQGLYLPSMRTKKFKACVALDTSGSTFEDMAKFMSEVNAMMRQFSGFELTIIQCDAEIQKVDTFIDQTPDFTTFELAGGGGTDFRPVFEYVNKKMREKPDIMLFFTDGEGPAPERNPGYPVCWLLTKNGHKPASWGTEIHFKNED